jgi:nicotinamide-nucleotide amidase
MTLTLETISTGDELVRGRSVDTNAPWMAARAAEYGVLRVRHSTVGDDLDALEKAYRTAAGRADIVVSTGGLGPTEDDHTRAAAAGAAGVELVEHSDLMREIEERFASRGIPMHPKNRVQALIPAGATVIRNPLGTAPGFQVTIGGSNLFFLSGVPREMEVMFESGVLPFLRGHGPGGAYRTIPCFGKPEAWIDERIEDLSARDDLSVGVTAVYGVIRVTIQATGADAAGRADEAEAVVRERMGDLVLARPTLAGAVGALLAERGATLATAESCTGGSIGRLLTDVPGISEHYLGGIVAYANAVKEKFLAVPAATLETFGAVSEETARAMAEGARTAFGTDWAVSVTGIAGPGGGTAEKPVGLVWFAVAGPDGTTALTRTIPGERDSVRRFAANIALNLLRRRLQTAAIP